jgi:hypothetical protein
MEQIVERRVLRERRERDVGPPAGCADRRRMTERRVPRLPENAMSDAEWQLLVGIRTSSDDETVGCASR